MVMPKTKKKKFSLLVDICTPLVLLEVFMEKLQFCHFLTTLNAKYSKIQYRCTTRRVSN